MTDNDNADELAEISNGFIDAVLADFQARIAAWKVDFSREIEQIVCGALLARQATMAIEIAAAPSIWNGHVAPLILRAMADVFINLAWIMQEPAERGRKFIMYGLGQAKLELEHRKGKPIDAEESDESNYVVAQEGWINSQRAMFLLDVDLGPWAGIQVREMAEQAKCLDFYRYVYTPFSACSHSMWHHIGKYNVKVCNNILHRFHYLPDTPAPMLDPHYLYLAAKYFEKTLRAFDRHIEFQANDQPTAFDFLVGELKQLGEPDTTVTSSVHTDQSIK